MAAGSGRLTGKVAVVTGSGRGIGAAIARRFASDGAAVVVHYLTHEAEGRSLVEELRATGAVADGVQADITDRAELARLFDAADTLGGLDVLVNNAGVADYVKLADATEEQYEHSVTVNFRGTLWAMQEAAQRMRDGGRIVNISTLATGTALADHSLYAATKAAVEQLALHGAVELADRGITVNSICPGSTETELFREAVPAEVVETVALRSHFKRLGQPADIAAVVAFLAGDDAQWVTGQRIVVSGGAS